MMMLIRMKNPPLDQTGGQRDEQKGKEPESASASSKTATRSAGRSTQGSRSRQASASESALVEEPMQTASQMEEPSHLEFDTGVDDQPINKTLPAVYGSIQPWITELAKQADSCSSFDKLMDTPLDFSNFLMNWLRVDTLTLELLAGPTYELMKGSCKRQQYPHNLLQPLPLIPNNKGHRVIPFEHFINNDLEYLRGGASSRKYTTSITKTKEVDYGHIKWIEDLVPRTMWITEPIGYDKHALWGRRIIAFTELKIVEWHSYKHLDWITVRRDDDKLVIQRRVEDLQLGVESYQKKLNLTKPDTYRSNLKRKEAYTAYSNPQGFIFQNKDKKNRLMRIDELHKFSDGTLTDVRTALDDRLKGIWMRYVPHTIWRKSDKDRVAAMI
nr:hypothetical protein [Tanacetum cinerariifolium]